jgi:hypothetical protein
MVVLQWMNKKDHLGAGGDAEVIKGGIEIR